MCKNSVKVINYGFWNISCKDLIEVCNVFIKVEVLTANCARYHFSELCGVLRFETRELEQIIELETVDPVLEFLRRELEVVEHSEGEEDYRDDD